MPSETCNKDNLDAEETEYDDPSFGAFLSELPLGLLEAGTHAPTSQPDGFAHTSSR